MKDVISTIHLLGVLPVVVIEDTDNALPLARALVKGELPCAEITLRTDAALGAIERISSAMPDFLVGAGTVLSVDQAEAAIKAGAKFIVMPGMDEKVINYCLERNVPVIPGCSTASEIQRALAMGLTLVKFFPAEQNGGLPFLKALGEPYKEMRFMPTGGINLDNLKNYLDWDRVIACGGSWIATSEMIKHHRFDEISQNAKEAVQKVLGFQIKHVGINCNNEIDAINGAQKFQNIFGFVKKEGDTNCFAGSDIELLKSPYLGEMGHIAIGTNNIERAIDSLHRKGIEIASETSVFSPDGKKVAVYMKEEICRFAIHLLQV